MCSSDLVLNGKKTNTLTVKVAKDDQVIAARGYMRYRKGQEVFVVYSDTVAKSYISLQ